MIFPLPPLVFFSHWHVWLPEGIYICWQVIVYEYMWGLSKLGVATQMCRCASVVFWLVTVSARMWIFLAKKMLKGHCTLAMETSVCRDIPCRFTVNSDIPTSCRRIVITKGGELVIWRPYFPEFPRDSQEYLQEPSWEHSADVRTCHCPEIYLLPQHQRNRFSDVGGCGEDPRALERRSGTGPTGHGEVQPLDGLGTELRDQIRLERWMNMGHTWDICCYGIVMTTVPYLPVT